VVGAWLVVSPLVLVPSLWEFSDRGGQRPGATAGGEHRPDALPHLPGLQPCRGVLWATGFVLLGFAAGPAWRTAERVAGRAGLLLLGVIVAGAATAVLVRRRRSGRHGSAAPEGPGRD
jgi:hypothetical protein